MPKSKHLDQQKINELIRRRESLRLSAQELDEKMGLSNRMTSKWETGIRSPTAANLDRWAQALGLKLVFKRVR